VVHPHAGGLLVRAVAVGHRADERREGPVVRLAAAL
jgi:hypothetical protein